MTCKLQDHKNIRYNITCKNKNVERQRKSQQSDAIWFYKPLKVPAIRYTTKNKTK